jgi:DNA-binding NarL/FixJ family response regulator
VPSRHVTQSATSDQSPNGVAGRELCAAFVSSRPRAERLNLLIATLDIRVYPFASAKQLIDRPPRASLALVVLLFEESDGSLVEQIEALRARFENVPVILASSDLPRWKVRKALLSGAAGIVFEEEIDAALGPCAHAVLAGQICVPSRNRAQIDPPVLSAREKQVLGLVVMGYMNSQIAQQLFLAESTVKSHLSSAFAKLGVRSRNEAVELIIDPEQGFGTGILALGGEPLVPAPMLDEAERDAIDVTAPLSGGSRII